MIRTINIEFSAQYPKQLPNMNVVVYLDGQDCSVRYVSKNVRIGTFFKIKNVTFNVSLNYGLTDKHAQSPSKEKDAIVLTKV